MVERKSAQVDKLADPATERLLDALWRAADVAYRLSKQDFDTERVTATGRAQKLRFNVKQLGRTALFDQSEDLAKIARAVEDISDGVECPHCAWAGRFYQSRHPLVWRHIVEIKGGRELVLPPRKKGPKTLRHAGRHATEESRWIGGIGSTARNLVKAVWGRPHLQGRRAEGDESGNRRDELDAIVRTERPSNWKNEVQLCSADVEPAREFITHAAAQGISHVESQLRKVQVTLPRPDDEQFDKISFHSGEATSRRRRDVADRFGQVPILEEALRLRKALDCVQALAPRRKSRRVTNNIVHYFLAELLDTSPMVIAGQLKKDLSDFPSLPAIRTNIEIS